ncbi:H/ACA ribonucleoprotein complex non-core subunit NAF1 [Lucilia cuprina]|uniref:H/ACA ribonucleoprotein complex non-core subunit NAF1 n=1 Tax=Lucilia cuprina TaxID=7375 RepID=A0A0L0CGB1_LUCCU|nr:H/ACA ribonucleoprotein complex non-core subunit NAF1 [Lucilia cuprina]
MDTNDSENLIKESTCTEEKSQQPVESQESKDINEDKIKEKTNVTTKETIEILQVELITPRTDEAVNTNTSNETENTSHVEECSEKMQTTQEQATKIQTECVAETNSTSNEMDTNDETDKAITEETTSKESSNQQPTTSGLGLLAQYDSDNESVVEVPIDGYRNQVVEIDSDSDSEDSSDSSDVEYLSELRKTIEKRMEVVDDDDDEDEESNTGKRKNTPRLKVKGEMLLEDLPPIQDLQITVPEDECIEFGKIHSVVDQLLLVSALPNSILLDLGTVIFLEKGQKVLGEVFDVLGQVADPLYCVRFNSNKQIKEKQINVGDVVYVAPKTQYTQYVILSNLMKIKGSDASWENDVEPPPRFLDYSDDEQEQLARRQLRNKDRPVDNDDPTKKPRTMEDEDANTNRYQQSNNSQRGRYNEQRNNNRGGGGRPRYNAPPHHNQQRAPNPNHHRSSWHSNYYPQSYPHQPSTANYGMPPVHNQPPPSQAYPPHVPMYGMPPMHNMPYPPPTQPAQYGAPPMLHQHNPQLIPNTFSIRPPTLHGPPPPHMAHHQQYSSTPPPPPGSQ